MAYKIPFVNPAKNYQLIKEEIDAAYFEVMSKGDLIDRGHLKSFEENLAKFAGTTYAVGLNSGYDALHLSLRSAGIGAGDEVVVPAHTFVATCSAVVNVGATPVLVDVAKDFNIDVDKIEEVITPKTKAIISVHLNGYMADMPRILKIAERYNLKAAFLDIKLRYLPSWIVKRKKIANSYHEAFSEIPDLLLPHYNKPGFDHIYQNYVVRSKQGDEFSEYLKKNGIEVLVQFRKPYYRHEALKLVDRGFPETEALSREVCSLPMNVEITDEEIEYVIKTVRAFYGLI